VSAAAGLSSRSPVCVCVCACVCACVLGEALAPSRLSNETHVLGVGEDHVPIIEQRKRHHTVAPVRRRIDVRLDLLSRLILRTTSVRSI
jgi:hypothetical protein